MLTGGMSPYEWTLNDRAWGRRHRLKVRRDQRVEIGFRNTSMMAHPMHLHGHHFQITKVNGRAVAGAMRDTVLVPPGSTVVVAFDANNPGRWLYHCHNLYHMMAGMMSEVTYADDPGPTGQTVGDAVAQGGGKPTPSNAASGRREMLVHRATI